MTLAEWKELANIFQAIAVGVAVLVGGGWALFRYFSLRSIQHAKADLEKTRVEIESARRELLERGIIEVSLEAEQMFFGNDYLINAQVKLKNTGSGTEVLDWEETSMTAQKVNCLGDGSVNFSEDLIIGERPRTYADASLAPSEISEYSFIIRVPSSGIYHLYFHSACSPQATQLGREERDRAGIKQPYNIVWSTSKFFQVKDM